MVDKPGIKIKLFLCILAFVLLHCSPLLARQKTIHVAAAIYEPFVMEKDGKLTGFDVDLLELICRLHGIDYTITLTSFQGMLDMVKDGQADMAIGCVYVTDERRQWFNYTEPYLEGGLVLAIRADTSVSSINGLQVGVKHDATGEQYIQRLIDDGNVIRLRDYTSTLDSFRALNTEKVDAVLNNFYNSVFLIQRNFAGEITLARNIWGIKMMDRREIGFPVAREKAWLKELLDMEIEHLKRSGSFDSLYSKWFTVPYPVSGLRYLLIIVFILLTAAVTSVLVIRYRNRKMRTHYLRQTETHFHQLVNSLPVGIFIIREGTIIMTNNEGARILGAAGTGDTTGTGIDSFYNSYTILYNDEQSVSCDSIHEFLKEPPSGTDAAGIPVYNASWARKDGNSISLVIRSRQVKWMDGHAYELVAHDMSILLDLHEERENLREQLTQSQKFEAIGQLAGGIAHDFNNILTVIQGYAELISAMSSEDNSRENARIITESCQRASDLTTKLLTFSRRSSYKTMPVHLHNVLEEITTIIQRTFPRNVTIISEANAGEDLVFGNANQLHQAIMNICINSRDAMPDGGTITIATDNITLTRNKTTRFGMIEPGNYIKMSITDNGSGIENAKIKRIFEPFYTTKPSGKGTGLGLSMSYGTVSQHNGFIDVESAPGKGTTFSLFFPLHEGPEEVSPGMHIPLEETTSGEGEVVIIDDEKYILDYLGRVVVEAGYSVHRFSNPVEGLEYIQSHADSVDGVLLDMMMPHMQGEEVFNGIKETGKNIPVIIMSGYTSENTPNQMLEKGAAAYIAKPIRSVQLLRTMKEIISR